MTGLINRTLITIITRLLNYGVLLLSPILLVRLLDVDQYGYYREFILYASLSISIFSLGLKSNLLYFIPKRKNSDISQVVSNTVLLMFLSSIVSIIVIFLASSTIRTYISFDFTIYLAIYVFLFINLDVFENLLLALKKPQQLLVISTMLAVARIGVVILSSLLYGEVHYILTSLIAFELVRIIITIIWLLKKGYFALLFERILAKEQWKYSYPLGLSSFLNVFNQRAGELVISLKHGADILAIYTIGAYQIPLLNIVRSAVNDSIFPDIVGQTDKLYLWRLSNVLYFLITVPIVFLLFVNSELFIKTLFTEKYIGAEPIFQFMLLLMVRQCFEMSTPLRAVGKNHYGLIACVAGLIVNITVLSQYQLSSEIWFPALALLIADFTGFIFLTVFVMRLYKVKFHNLLFFRDLSKIIFCLLISALTYYYVEIEVNSEIFQVTIKSVLFFIAYLSLVSISRIGVFDMIMKKLMLRLKNNG